MPFTDLSALQAQTQDIIDKATAAAKKAGTYKEVATPPNDPLYKDYSVYTDTAGNTYVSGKGGVSEFFIVPPAKGKDTATVTDDVNTARNALIEAYGGTDKLAVALKNAGYTGDFYTNVNNAIRRYSVDTLSLYQESKGSIKLPEFTSYLTKLKSELAAGATKTRVEQNFTDRAGADRYINGYLADMIGRPATAEEKAAFYKELNTAESKTRTLTTTVSDGQGGFRNVKSVGSSLSDTDRMLIASKVVKGALKGTTIEQLLNSSTGSKIAEDITKIRSAASDYGLPLDDKAALKYVADGVGQSDYVNKQIERMRQTSMTMYKNLADHLKAGGTVKDVADQYAYIKARKLGVVVADSTQDKDIMDAINNPNGLLSQSDFNRQMQANPLWRKTEEAHNIAADFTNTILQSFGFGG